MDNNAAKHNGALRHWLLLRITAVACVPLVLWMVYSLIHLIGADYGVFRGWLLETPHGLAMAVSIIIVFYHTALGLHEIVEDYVHQPAAAKAAILGINLVFLIGGLIALISIARIIFTAGA